MIPLNLGGQHGQESEEGEEGEERSEEDCEEDPQGRQEEVSSLELAAGDFVAGTSFGANRVDLTQSEKLRATQRGCRRDIRSNGWIELWKGACADPGRSGRRKTDFLRSVRAA